MKYTHFDDICPNHRPDFVMLYFAACRSLRELQAAIRRANGGKLRASVTEFSKQKYDMKVSCKYLRDIFKTKDVDVLNNMVAESQYAHCRIGLARKFLIQENHCYLMLNGLFLY